MNASNWKDFLLPDGTPSAKCIVEGANLFLTAEARQGARSGARTLPAARALPSVAADGAPPRSLGLFDACGLPIVKDSSANKCGVVCSSMEIVASMSLSDDEFLQMKPVYVEQVRIV